ncbi:hypothetical protein [Nonomuraea rubra]|uniref:hypothetical protein n=1 Tax=Nonomuraea rubra TaxID=46180 RepID=UPI0033ED256E
MRRTSSAERIPATTPATAGCRRGKAIAASGSVTPWASQTSAMRATQFGYAAGIMLLVPLGDRIPHRRLIVGLRAEARSRLTTAFMACSYLGGAVGSWLGTLAYGQAGWPAVCALVALTAALALARHLTRRRWPGRRWSRSRSSGGPGWARCSRRWQSRMPVTWLTGSA